MFNLMTFTDCEDKQEKQQQEVMRRMEGEHTGLFSKRKYIADALEKFTVEADNTIAVYTDMVRAYLGGRRGSQLEALSDRVRHAESRCDYYRREIEYNLYSGALIPGIRGDIFMLLESFDKVPNKAEDVANFIALANPDVPEDFHQEIMEILRLTLKCAATLSMAVNQLFVNLKEAVHKAKEVEILESAIDKLERQLVRRVFSADMDMGRKLMLRELINMIGAISNRAENASDRIEIIALKMKT